MFLVLHCRHGDCAHARAGYGARRWARGRPGRASAGRFAASQRLQRADKLLTRLLTRLICFSSLFEEGSEELHQQNEAVGNTGAALRCARARALFSRWRLISEASLPVFQRGGEEF